MGKIFAEVFGFFATLLAAGLFFGTIAFAAYGNREATAMFAVLLIAEIIMVSVTTNVVEFFSRQEYRERDR
jgi:hypothetical protein